MKNLKTETLEILAENGKTADDVQWVGGVVGMWDNLRYVNIPVETFWKVADRRYDDGFGGVEVRGGLIIVGDNWWLERHEYDGSEWWEFKTLPLERPTETVTEDAIRAVFNPMYLGFPNDE